MNKSRLIILLLFSILILNAKTEIEIRYLNEKPIIDGVISSDEWEDAIKIDKFYQISPGDNAIPSSKTEAFMGYDDQNIYLMAKCYFNDLQRLRDFHCSRDHIYTTDRIFFFFDTFHSNEQAYYVGCNVNGEQADGIVIDNIAPSIDLYYQPQGSKTDFGYIVELKVPLKSLKYRSGEDEHGYESGFMEDYDKYELTLFLKPSNIIDIEVEQKYHEMDDLYIARTIETKLKVQFHKNFWIKAILQYKNNDLFYDNENDEDFSLYPFTDVQLLRGQKHEIYDYKWIKEGKKYFLI